MAVEKIRISHKEYLSGKWARVSQGSELRNPRDGSSSQTYYEARVIRNSDGSIDESSFSKEYRKQLHEKDKKGREEQEKRRVLEKNPVVSLQTYMVGCEDGIGYSQSRYSF